MEHSFFFDGTIERISWVIQTNDSKIKQERGHPSIYLKKVTIEQSKYIALYVGLFWGIGRFIINNKDNIIINFDDKKMYDDLSKIEKHSD